MRILIDANELKERAYDEASKMNNSLAELGNTIDWLVSKCPIIDAEPVIHGQWEFCAESVETMWNCKCSVCGSVEQPLQRHRYCPNCGAKMDLEVEE